MLWDGNKGLLTEMDRFEVTRRCWMCANLRIETCMEAKRFLEDMMGVKFASLDAKVSEQTNADACSGFELTDDPDTLGDLIGLLRDAQESARDHENHINHLFATTW